MHPVHLMSILFKLALKLLILHRQYIGLWEHIVLIWKSFEHFHKATCQLLFV